MADQTQILEYNLLYEEDDEFEYPVWRADLAEVTQFYDALGRNPAETAAYTQARIVQRTRVTFTTDWEYVSAAN